MYEQSHPSKRGPIINKAPTSTIIWKVVREVRMPNTYRQEGGIKLISAACSGSFSQEYPTMQWVAAHNNTIGLLAFDALRWAVSFAIRISGNAPSNTYHVMEAEGYDPRPIIAMARRSTEYDRAIMEKAQQGMPEHYFFRAPAGTVAVDVLRTRRVAATVRHEQVGYAPFIQNRGI